MRPQPAIFLDGRYGRRVRSMRWLLLAAVVIVTVLWSIL